MTTLPARQVHDGLSRVDAARLQRGEPVIGVIDGGPLALLVPVPDQPLVAMVAAQRPRQGLWRIPLALALLAPAIWLVVWTTLRPLQSQLESLSDAAARVGEGDLAARAPVHGDEVGGQLARRFNEMVERVERVEHAGTIGRS